GARRRDHSHGAVQARRPRARRRRQQREREVRGRLRHLQAVAPWLVIVWFAALAVWLCARKAFAIDEFGYSHAAWLLGQGSVPYRDFFDVHFPLVYQLLGAAFAAFRLQPADVEWMRLSMLPFVALAAYSAAKVNRDVLAAAFLLAGSAFLARFVEIRPDVVGYSFFLAALASPRRWVSGLALALAC